METSIQSGSSLKCPTENFFSSIFLVLVKKIFFFTLYIIKPPAYCPLGLLCIVVKLAGPLLQTELPVEDILQTLFLNFSDTFWGKSATGIPVFVMVFIGAS